MANTQSTPSFKITIKGKDLPLSYRKLIDNISFEDYSTGSDLLKISFSDPDFVLIEDSLLVEDVKITFDCPEKAIHFSGYVSVVDIDFPSVGIPSIVLNCMDKTHLMNRTPKSRTWENTKISSVVTQIYREYGFIANVDDTGTVEESIAQSDQTDIDFITSLCEDGLIKYLAYIEGDTGYFKKRNENLTPSITLTYRKDDMSIMSFNPRINKEQIQQEVETSDVDSSSKETSTSTSYSEEDTNIFSNTSSVDESEMGYKFVDGKWVQV